MVPGDPMERMITIILSILFSSIATFSNDLSLYSVIPISIGILFIGAIELIPVISVKRILSWSFLGLATQLSGLYTMIPVLGFIHPLFKNKYEYLHICALFSLYGFLFRNQHNIIFFCIFFLFEILLNVSEQRRNKFKKLYEELFIQEFLSRRKYAENREQWNTQKDSAVFTAIVTERNHITRDIHDGVGHLLSRAILQTGALIVTESDQERKSQLTDLKTTLTESMEAMRKSLHNLQSEIVDLEKEIHRRTDNFNFCSLELQYDIFSNLPLKVKYALINIVDESMNNVIKHSNATVLRIGLRESGQKIYVLIHDNGTVFKGTNSGMGLKSMESRIKEIGGTIQFSSEKGFRIFIQIPITGIFGT